MFSLDRSEKMVEILAGLCLKISKEGQLMELTMLTGTLPLMVQVVPLIVGGLLVGGMTEMEMLLYAVTQR